MKRFWMVMCVITAACGDNDAEPLPDTGGEASAADQCDAAAARAVVEQFGGRLNDVSLLAPDSIVTRAMRAAYGPLVTANLLETWLSDPANAPGRQVSSPWPARIEIRSAESAGADECRVEGDVVYVTSADTAGAAAREQVVISVRNQDGWRIASYDVAAPVDGADPSDASGPSSDNGDSPNTGPPSGGSQPAVDDAAAAASVLRQYYAAINAGEYRRAYSLWSGNGSASRQTFDEFAAGFAETARVQADVGTPGRIEAAAGSRYIELPVTVEAETEAGAEQSFAGTYTLRRSVVDGATPEQRSWRIYSADVHAR